MLADLVFVGGQMVEVLVTEPAPSVLDQLMMSTSWRA